MKLKSFSRFLHYNNQEQLDIKVNVLFMRFIDISV